jgi:sulfur-carrier protein
MMPNTIQVTVKLFAAYQEAFQVPELQMELPIDTPVAVVCDRLIADRPALMPWRDITQFGVNLEQVSPQQILQDGDEVVLIPPVSGG